MDEKIYRLLKNGETMLETDDVYHDGVWLSLPFCLAGKPWIGTYLPVRREIVSYQEHEEVNTDEYLEM